MRAYRSRCVWILAVLLLGIGVAAPGAKADSITYNYTGNTFTTCTYAAAGSCPANFTSDYLIASVTFSSPLPANLSYTDTAAETAALANLTGWTVKDALGYFSYSSVTTPTYLTGFPSNSAPPVAFSTDGQGNITTYVMDGFPAEVLGILGASEFFLLNPPISDPQSPVLIAEGVEIGAMGGNEWDAVTSTPGNWTVPEPSTLLLGAVGVTLTLLAGLKFGGQAANS